MVGPERSSTAEVVAAGTDATNCPAPSVTPVAPARLAATPASGWPPLVAVRVTVRVLGPGAGGFGAGVGVVGVLGGAGVAEESAESPPQAAEASDTSRTTIGARGIGAPRRSTA